MLPWRSGLNEDEIVRVKELEKNLKDKYQLRLAVLDQEQLVGWTFGWQDSGTTFFMGASIILPEYRRKGLYSKLIEKVLEITNLKGFQTVTSCHIVTNNPVIIAKLKHGFSISSLEMDAVHGALVRLSYHHNALLKAAAKFRAGAVGEAKIKQLLDRSLEQ